MRRRLSAAAQEALTRDLAALPHLGLADLRERWRELCGSEPLPALWRSLLVRAIAYRLQEKAIGALTPATRRWLSQAADDVAGGQPIARRALRIKPGTRLLREWQGVTHEVIVAEDGALYRGKRYRSLSEVARTITGSRWSGPLFFGLKNSTDDRHASP
jgi:Protein of unknown function (DUF2924)